MREHLLDANVVIALAVQDHEHHDRAHQWLAGGGDFAVCPIVEGALVRFLLRVGESPRTVAAMIERITTQPRCRFWPDDLSFRDVDLSRVRGHRQVTDTYLVALAERHDGLLATFDRALASARPASTLLIP